MEIDLKKLSQKILDCITEGPVTFKVLIGLLPDVDIQKLGDALQGLLFSKQVVRNEMGVYDLIEDSVRFKVDGHYERKFLEIQNLLPMPHELDGDWRFTYQAANHIIQLAQHELILGKRVCCLGTPSLAILLSLTNFECDIDLIDINEKNLSIIKSSCSNINTYCYDVVQKEGSCNIDEKRYDVVFLDPPWDGPHISLFIEFGGSLLRTGGLLSIVYFPDYHREFAEYRQYIMYSNLAKLNLLPKLVLPDCVEIKNKVDLSNINGNLPSSINAIKGSLCICEKIVSYDDQDIFSNDASVASKWDSVCISGSKWMLRRINSNSYEPPKIVRLDFAKSIFKDESLAFDVDLWTSGNQLFSVKGSNVVFLLLTGISEEKSRDEIVVDIASYFNKECTILAKDNRITEALNVLVDAVNIENSIHNAWLRL